MPATAATPDAPNVLVIMCDQLRWDTIGAHGHPLVRTPHLDALIAAGTTFDRAYTEAPVCVPARATMMTGRLAHRNGVFDNGDVLPADVFTFASVAQRMGYRTQAVGKMHFTPTRQPYGLDRLDLSEEIPDRVDSDEFLQHMIDAGFGHVQEPHGIRHELYYTPQVSQLPQDLHTTAWTGRTTAEFIEAQKANDQPWLCWTSFIKPHPPFDPPAPWYRMYDPLDVPDPVRADTERNDLEYRVRSQNRYKWTSPELPLSAIRTMRAYYYASISFVDEWIGRILASLDATGQRDNTMIVFTADHGESLGDHWAYGKRTYYDSAARIPLVISWPGHLPEGRRVSELVGLADVGPSIVDACGAPGGLGAADGQSLVAFLRDGDRWSSARREWIGVLGHGANATYAIFDDRAKYVYSAADDLGYGLRMGDAETSRLRADDPLAAHAHRLGEVLRERLGREGMGRVLDDGGWRRFPPPDLIESLDDRDHEGRGWQYAQWCNAVGICE